MDLQMRKALKEAMWKRYRKAPKTMKTKILDELCAVTGSLDVQHGNRTVNGRAVTHTTQGIAVAESPSWATIEPLGRHLGHQSRRPVLPRTLTCHLKGRRRLG
jgi:hypothetical protein